MVDVLPHARPVHLLADVDGVQRYLRGRGNLAQRARGQVERVNSREHHARIGCPSCYNSFTCEAVVNAKRLLTFMTFPLASGMVIMPSVDPPPPWSIVQ